MNAPERLWSLWDVLRNYLPLYQVALRLAELRATAALYKSLKTSIYDHHFKSFAPLIEDIQHVCLAHGFTHTAGLAKHVASKPPPEDYGDMFSALDYLNKSLSDELENEAIFSIPPARKAYFECDELFGPQVATAFPSCARDIQRAGSCYALEQEDACVHHLMLVLERGLNALAEKVGVTYQRTNWQVIIDQIAAKLKSSLPKGAERDFYIEVNSQFGFLKNAYRNHSEHAHDDPYDMDKALSILNHVRAFMLELARGGLSE